MKSNAAASPKRYAIIGTGARSEMYSRALLSSFAKHGVLVAFCDLNALRPAYWNRIFARDYQTAPIPYYRPEDFEKMITEERVDEIIVTTIDRTHHTYICKAMAAGCDVITEKPMTTDPESANAIRQAIEATGRRLRVTFNYRYSPRNSRVKELLDQKVIGEVISVHFEWLLNTQHGADYFRRWHRDRRNSGGLLVHKSTHHFDLVNWWLGTAPETVFAMGDLRFYGKVNAESREISAPYHRTTGVPAAHSDPFALHLDTDPILGPLYYETESADGYLRDQSVFSDGISIEDDLAVLVRYRNRAVLSYHLTAYSPWEGFRVMFNGTKGRLEYECVEVPYVSGSNSDHNAARDASGAAPNTVEEPTSIILHPLWERPVNIPLAQANEGGHGGGDQLMLHDLFVGTEHDSLQRAAGFQDGLKSILTGIAANRSIASGLPVSVRDL